MAEGRLLFALLLLNKSEKHPPRFSASGCRRGAATTVGGIVPVPCAVIVAVGRVAEGADVSLCAVERGGEGGVSDLYSRQSGEPDMFLSASILLSC